MDERCDGATLGMKGVRAEGVDPSCMTGDELAAFADKLRTELRMRGLQRRTTDLIEDLKRFRDELTQR